VLGSDIGGYLDRNDKDLLGGVIPLDPVNFARWTAIGGLSPFMQLHGRANLTPWTVPQNGTEIADNYRFWSKLHHELVPFWYSLAEEAYAGADGILRPIGAEAEWAGDYRYALGEALFVAPLLDGTGKRDVVLPAGANYFDFWTPNADPLMGGTTQSVDFSGDLQKIPLYFRSGAIVPMSVSDDVTGFGNAASAGKLTILVFPDVKPSSFSLHDEDDQTTTIQAQASAGGNKITLSRSLAATLLRVRVEKAPQSVLVAGKPAMVAADRAAFDSAMSGSSYYDAMTRSVWIKVGASPDETLIEVAVP